MQTRIQFMILLTISTPAIICGIIPDEEVKVIVPGEFTPKKEAFFWQRQIIILLVPNNGLGIGGGLGGIPGGGLGGLPGQGGFNPGFGGRLRNVQRLRSLRRRTGLRTRTTTPNFESIDTEN